MSAEATATRVTGATKPPPPFTPEQFQWIDRLVAARQMQQTQDPSGAPGSSATALPTTASQSGERASQI